MILSLDSNHNEMIIIIIIQRDLNKENQSNSWTRCEIRSESKSWFITYGQKKNHIGVTWWKIWVGREYFSRSLFHLVEMFTLVSFKLSARKVHINYTITIILKYFTSILWESQVLRSIALCMQYCYIFFFFFFHSKNNEKDKVGPKFRVSCTMPM